ncbi:MAG: hypothetical protein HY706_04195 [Candidatus Hydrogenedentes bacterium]|nr:hypothetical protein [Candidatus Hydrogenedentota bacterium]
MAVDLRSGQVTRQDMDLTGVGVIAGTVTGVGADERAHITILPGQLEITELPRAGEEPWWASQVLAGAPVNADGSFRIEGLEPGTCTLVVMAVTTQAQTIEEVRASTRFTTAVVTVPAEGEATVELTLP